MIRMIAACSYNGVIGVNNSIPFHYSEDLKHFKQSTQNGIVIMGRKTFESLDNKPLPKRRNIVITKFSDMNVENYTSLDQALAAVHDEENIWLIGGAAIYQAGMSVAHEIVLTITPDIIKEENCIRFPWINPLLFNKESVTNLGDNGLKLIRYCKS